MSSLLKSLFRCLDDSVNKHPLLLESVCLDVDGKPVKGQMLSIFNLKTGKLNSLGFVDPLTGQPVAGTVKINEDPCACEQCGGSFACALVMLFDVRAQRYLDAGMRSEFVITSNGAVIAHELIDYLVASDGVNKSSWFTQIIDAINNSNSGWKFTVHNDVSVNEFGKVAYRIEYSGSLPAVLEIRSGVAGSSPLNDLVKINIDQNGLINVTTLSEDIQAKFGTDPYLGICPGTGKEVQACILMDAWDVFAESALSAGTTNELEIKVDGVIKSITVHDYLTTSNHTNKSSWYTPWTAAIDNLYGCSFELYSDAPVTALDLKARWRLAYQGVAPTTIEFAKYLSGDRAHADLYKIEINANGDVTTSTNDISSGIPFGTDPFHPCEE